MLWQSLHNIPDLGPQEAAYFSRWQMKVADGCLHAPQQGSITTITCYFHLVPLCGSESVSPCALLKSISSSNSSSSALRAMNLFHSCKSSGGTGALLLVPEVTSFQPLSSPEFPLTILLGTDSACVCTAVGVLGSEAVGSLRDPVYLSFILFDATQPAHFLP